MKNNTIITFDIDAEGNKYWYKNEKIHKDGGPAIEYANGNQAWYQEGKLHRLDGTAIVCLSGVERWYKDGKLHRENAPAIIFADGSKEWWINGEKISEQEVNAMILFKELPVFETSIKAKIKI